MNKAQNHKWPAEILLLFKMNIFILQETLPVSVVPRKVTVKIVDAKIGGRDA